MFACCGCLLSVVVASIFVVVNAVESVVCGQISDNSAERRRRSCRLEVCLIEEVALKITVIMFPCFVADLDAEKKWKTDE